MGQEYRKAWNHSKLVVRFERSALKAVVQTPSATNMDTKIAACAVSSIVLTPEGEGNLHPSSPMPWMMSLEEAASLELLLIVVVIGLIATFPLEDVVLAAAGATKACATMGEPRRQKLRLLLLLSILQHSTIAIKVTNFFMDCLLEERLRIMIVGLFVCTKARVE